MPQRRKCGNPHRLPKKRRQRQPLPAPSRQQHALVPIRPPRAPASSVRPVEQVERARLTLHTADPITGNEDTLYTLFYEEYRGYANYSTPEGRCCIHGKQGCLKLRGKFVCFPDFEDAKTLIKRLRAEGYTSSDPVERSVPEWEYVCLNRHEQQRASTLSSAMQRVSYA